MQQKNSREDGDGKPHAQAAGVRSQFMYDPGSQTQVGHVHVSTHAHPHSLTHKLMGISQEVQEAFEHNHKGRDQ